MPKRKHDETSEPLPDTITMDAMEVVDKNDVNLAVYFPSGFNPNSKEAKDCEWQTFSHGERRKQYALVAKTGTNIDFVGTTNSAEYTTALPCRYALGVYDKSTGTLEVAPLAAGRIIRMEPRARSLSYSATAAAANDKEEAAAAERRAQNMRLVEEFGSQRRRRQLAAAKAGQVDAVRVSAGDALLGIIASQNDAAETKEAVIARALGNRNIPPHHPEATSAKDAYSLREIIPPSVYDALEIKKLFPAESKPEYKQELRTSRRFGTGYVLSRLKVLSSAANTREREDRARCLVMLGHLLKLHTHRGPVLRADNGIAELAKKVQMETSVLEGLLDLFYSREAGFEGGDKYMLSKENKDLMLGYILILAVKAEPECSLEPEGYIELSNELKMRQGDLIQYFRELGCTDASVTSTNEEGGKVRSYKVTLMPENVEEPKRLQDCFPGLKLGGKKPGGR